MPWDEIIYHEEHKTLIVILQEVISNSIKDDLAL
jgi:hypothetical protein